MLCSDWLRDNDAPGEWCVLASHRTTLKVTCYNKIKSLVPKFGGLEFTADLYFLPHHECTGSGVCPEEETFSMELQYI